ncbi:UNVERIFIED_CONTAM: hypothetical protein NCL1_54648 [Trichonephila clavipes]
MAGFSGSPFLPSHIGRVNSGEMVSLTVGAPQTMCFPRCFNIQGDSLPDRHTGRVCRGTETTRNQIGMQGCKSRSCELWCKDAEKKNRNINTLMRHKTFIEKYNTAGVRKCMNFFF